jgi:hypothetical protein
MYKAWHIRCNGESGIVIAQKPSRAKSIMFASARDCGINVDWRSITVRRAKEFDGLALNRERGPYTPEHAKMMVKP